MTIELITVREVHESLAHRGDPPVQLIDVRETDEIATGTVPGARHIPLGEVAARITEIDPERPIWAICRSGNRSGQAAEIWQAHGLRVRNMQGGMLAWHEAGYPVETR